MKLSEFILQLLQQQNVRHIFGVPGDYNLEFIDFIEAHPAIQWIGICNELNASYAADGYARENGFGVFLTTHGVGELSAVNGIAGSYAENVPVLQIVGYPSSIALDSELPVHHTLAHGNKSNFFSCFQDITCAFSILSKSNFIDKILTTIVQMILTKKPAVICMPCDLFAMDISDRIEQAEIIENISIAPDELIGKIKKSYVNSKKPVLLLGSDIKCFGWVDLVQALVHKLNIPFATIFMGKCVLSEQDDHYIGVYAGTLSHPNAARETVENSDCVISIGARRTDLTTGGFSDKYLKNKNHIVISSDSVCVGKVFCKNINISSLLKKLIDVLPHKTDVAIPYFEPNGFRTDEWTQNNFWPYFSQKILQPNDIIAVEAGTSLFGLLCQKLPHNVSLISQILWASIGYTLPALLGALLAKPAQKGVLVIGDGSFLLYPSKFKSWSRELQSP